MIEVLELPEQVMYAICGYSVAMATVAIFVRFLVKTGRAAEGE